MTLIVNGSSPPMGSLGRPRSAINKPGSPGLRRADWVSSTENLSDLNDDKHPSTRAYFGAQQRRPARGALGADGARLRAMSNSCIGPSVVGDANITRNPDEISKPVMALASNPWPAESQPWLNEIAPHMERLRADICLHCQELAATVTSEFERHHGRQSQKHPFSRGHVQQDMVTELALKLAPHLEKSLEAQEERILEAAAQQWHAKGVELAETWSEKAHGHVSTQAQQQCNDMLQAISSDAEKRQLKLIDSLQKNVFLNEVKPKQVVDTVRLELETLCAKCTASIHAASSEQQNRALQAGWREVENLVKGMMNSSSDAATAVLRSDVKSVVQEELHRHREHSTRQLEAIVGEVANRHARLIETLGNEISLSVKGVGELVTSNNDVAASMVRSVVKGCVQEVFDEKEDHRSRQIETAVAEVERRHARLTESLSRDVGALVKREVDRHSERIAEKLQQESQTWKNNLQVVKDLLDDVNQRANDALRKDVTSREKISSEADQRHRQMTQSVQDIAASLKDHEEGRREQGQRHEELLRIMKKLDTSDALRKEGASRDSAEADQRHRQVAQSVQDIAESLQAQEEWRREQGQCHEELLKTMIQLDTKVGSNKAKSIEKIVHSTAELAQAIEALNAKASQNGDDIQETRRCLLELRTAWKDDAREARHAEVLREFRELDVRIGDQEEALRAGVSRHEQVSEAVTDLKRVLEGVAEMGHTHTEMLEEIQRVDANEGDEVVLEAIRNIESTIVAGGASAATASDAVLEATQELASAIAALDVSAKTQTDMLEAIRKASLSEAYHATKSDKSVMEAIQKIETTIASSGVGAASDTEAVLKATHELASSIAALDIRTKAHTDMLEAIHRIDFSKGSDTILERFRQFELACDNTAVLGAIKQLDASFAGHVASASSRESASSQDLAELSAVVKKLESRIVKPDNDDHDRVQDVMKALEKLDQRLMPIVEQMSENILCQMSRSSSDVQHQDMTDTITSLSKLISDNAQIQDAKSTLIIDAIRKVNDEMVTAEVLQKGVSDIVVAERAPVLQELDGVNEFCQGIHKWLQHLGSSMETWGLQHVHDAIKKVDAEIVTAEVLQKRVHDIVVEERAPMMQELDGISSFCEGIHKWLEHLGNSMQEWGLQHVHTDMKSVTAWLESVHKVLKDAANKSDKGEPGIAPQSPANFRPT